MRRLTLLSSFMALLIACAAQGQPTNLKSWLGVWQGQLDGVPGTTLTLAEENGELGGTVVLNVVIRENGVPKVAGSTVHMVTHPRVEGNTLSFDITRPNDAKRLTMAVEMQGNDRMTLRCANCGEDAITAELVKNQP